MEKPNHTLTTVTASEGKTLSIVGDTYRIVISGKQTGGAYAVIDMLIPPNGGPGPHAHADFQESFHVLEGEIEVKSEQGNYTAQKGAFVNIPLGGMVHCFKNKTDTLARLWCVVIPSGLEEFFEEIGRPVKPGQFLPPPELSQEEAQKLKTIAEQYGQKLYPPDYLK